MLTTRGLLLAILSTVNAVPTRQHRVHGTRIESSHFHKLSQLSRDTVLPVKIALAQQNLEKGDEWLQEVSDPTSPKYGQHWTPEQIIEAFRPSKETYQAVYAWLTSAGIDEDRIDTNVNHWMTFNASVDEAESLFHTTYHIFEHEQTGMRHIACDSYSVPEHLFPHIDLLTPSVHLNQPLRSDPLRQPISDPPLNAPLAIPEPAPHKGPKPNAVAAAAAVAPPTPYGPSDVQSLVQQSLAACGTVVHPGCVRFLYSVPINYQSNSANSFGIVEYAPRNYNEDDLTYWYQHFSQRQIGTFPEFFSVDGGQLYHAADANETEGVLDFDLANIVWPQQTELFQAGANNGGASLGNFLDAIDNSFCTYEGGDDPDYDWTYPDAGYSGTAMCGTYRPPLVLSTSYGYNEYGFLLPSYPRYQTWLSRQCYEYMKLGLAGTSVVFASGDNGVGCQLSACYTYNNVSRFTPSFPNTCPYVTSVGATQVDPNIVDIADATAGQQEVAVNGSQFTPAYYSGGGFSDFFPLPSYQQSAVNAYQSSATYSFSNQYNASGQMRGFPDVSANGWLYPISVDDGSFTRAGGTSASAPTFAGLLTLINQERLNAGKSSIGFINPALYANTTIFNDVTSGSNPGCGTTGFKAGPGWDPVSGLGSPRFSQMLAYFLSLP